MDECLATLEPIGYFLPCRICNNPTYYMSILYSSPVCYDEECKNQLESIVVDAFNQTLGGVTNE